MKLKDDCHELPIHRIQVGPRHRRDLGDVDALAASIRDLSLLQPVVVTPAGELVAGRRRLEAVRTLGWRTVPVHVVHGLDDRLQLLRAERDENTCRKDFLPTEAVSIGREIRAEIAAEAAARQKAGKSADGRAGGRGRKKPSPKLDEGFSGEGSAANGRTDDRVAEAVGMGRETYRKAEEVVAAAEEDPETFADLPPLMDETSPDAAFRELKRRQRKQARDAATPPPAALADDQQWTVECADCLDWFPRQPPLSIDLCLGSGPYEKARTYLEDGEDLGIARDTDEWVAFMVQVYQQALRVCKVVAFVVGHGKTEDFRWSGAPALLAADLIRAGVCLRDPKIYHRSGTPGSGGEDDLRKDFEWVLIATHGGKLPWSDNLAMGHQPKYGPGGDPTHRRRDGSRANTYATRAERKIHGSFDAQGRVGRTYTPPEVANPGNVIHAKVGGGHLGSDLASENEAPYSEDLAEFMISWLCPPGGIVCDPFAGSGTTAAVAKKLGRFFRGCDIRQSQVDLTRRRLAEVPEPGQGDTP
jgi:ParB-like chromosome segregation protein Spo0J